MDSDKCVWKTTADAFPPRRCVNTHLSAEERETDKTDAFMEVLALADDQLTPADIRKADGSSKGFFISTSENEFVIFNT